MMTVGREGKGEEDETGWMSRSEVEIKICLLIRSLSLYSNNNFWFIPTFDQRRYSCYIL